MLKQYIDKVLEELSLNNLQGDERYDVVAQLVDHFNGIIIDTVMTNLDIEQLKRFKELVESDDDKKLDEGISNLVAEIPEIHFKIERAIDTEMQNLKSAKAIMDNA
jgi:regulator of sigma D